MSLLKNKLKSIFIAFASCVMIAFTATLIPQAIFSDYFFIDDAVNENLPFYKEVGRIVLNGEYPLLTTKTFLGGNLVVDMVISPFSPQTLLTGVIAAKVDSITLPTYFLAWFNAFLISAGCLWLAWGLGLSRLYAVLLALVVSTSPVYMYIFAASWWNLAGAFAWFVVAVAAALNYAMNPTKAGYALACLFSSLLFTTAGTQAHVSYSIVIVILAVFSACKKSSVSSGILVLSILVVSVLVSAVPIYGEYLASSKFIDRVSEFNNNGNFLVPNLNQILNAFNPFYHGFIHFFGGYRHLPIALGYAGLMVLPAIVYFKKPTMFVKSWLFYTMIAATALYMMSLCSQQTGPLRWPFRFAPFATLFVSLASVSVLARGQLNLSKARTYGYMAIVLLSTWIQFFSQEEKIFTTSNFFMSLMFIVACAMIMFAVYLQHLTRKHVILPILLIVLQLGLWSMSLHYNPTLAKKWLSHPTLKKHWPSAISEKGYVLGLANEASSHDPASGSCAHFLFHDIKSINGYSPVGHKAFAHFFPHRSAHGHFVRHETLNNMTAYDPELNTHVYSLFNISEIYAWRSEVPAELSNRISSSGMVIGEAPAEYRKSREKIVIRPNIKNVSEGTLSYQSVPNTVYSHDKSKQLKESWRVWKNDVPRTLVFSRIFWHGYGATINGQSVPVTSWRDTLVRLELPAGAEGLLELQYSPVSWKYTKWSVIVGLLIFMCSFCFHKCRYDDQNMLNLT
jgi:hypothetical protein